MGQVQGVLHVQPSVPFEENEDDCLPNGHDIMRHFRISRNCCIIRYGLFFLTATRICENRMESLLACCVYYASGRSDSLYCKKIHASGLHWLIKYQVIVARNRAYIKNVSTAEENFWFRANGPPNPTYRNNADCVASVVIGWLGLPATFARYFLRSVILTINLN